MPQNRYRAAVTAFIDLHCHYLPHVDDGVRNLEESKLLLSSLRSLGFGTVIATPHMRPGLFDNTADDLRRAFDHTRKALGELPEGPALALSAEHYFSDQVYQRILDGRGLPYPGTQAVLLEFYETTFPVHVDQCLATLHRRGLRPVIAHPERYPALWGKPERLEQLLDVGAAALLDVAALVGKYGRAPKRCAQRFLELDLYEAACSDAHRPADVREVEAGLTWIQKEVGGTELTRLLTTGPHHLLGTATQP